MAKKSRLGRPEKGRRPEQARGLFVMSGAKAVEGPKVLRLVMTEDIVIAVIGTHAEVARFRGVPLAVQLIDLELASANGKTQRLFVSSVARIALDVDIAHRAPPRGWKDDRRRRLLTARLVYQLPCRAQMAANR